MKIDALEAVVKAADIYDFPHRKMALAISVALAHLAHKRSGGYGVESGLLTALADDFAEFT